MDQIYLILGYNMKFSLREIFSRKSKGINDFESIGRNSGYLHEWKKQRSKRFSKRLTKAVIFITVFAFAIIVSVYINMIKLRKIQYEQEIIVANHTPGPTEFIPQDTPEPYIYSEELTEALLDYADVIGYLKIADTGMDYPIVQGEDNYFFKNRNFDRSYSKVAATYMLSECDPNVTRHLTIYGENIDEDYHFGDLDEFLDGEFFYAHQYITLELLNGTSTWQVFSVHFATKSFNYNEVYFNSNTEYLAYIQMLESLSKYNTNVTLSEKDQVLTLTTDYFDLEDGYLLVHAKLIN